MLTLFLLLVTVINTLNGVQDETQAASNSDLASQDPLELPYEFQFTGRGRITAGTEDMWVIGGVHIQIDDHTRLLGNFRVGDFVNLSGRIGDDQVWMADRIELSEGGDPFFTYNGPLEWMRGSLWRLGGHTLLVDLQTDLGANLASSDVLLATFTVLESGAWRALEIKAFDPSVYKPTPTSTPTSTSTESPRKLDPTATLMPASAQHNVGGDDGYENKDEEYEEDEGDDEDEHGDENYDDRDEGEHDDEGDDEHGDDDHHEDDD